MNCSMKFNLISFPANGKLFGMVTNVNVPKYIAPYTPKKYIF